MNKPKVSKTNQKTPLAIKILTNTNRYEILKLLFVSQKDLCVHELSEAVGISQSATSHQLAYLESHGIVASVRLGKTKCYIPTDSPMVSKIKKVISLM